MTSLLLALAVVLLAGCGDDDGQRTALADFNERCVGVTESIEPAEIRFNDNPAMRLNETSEFVLQIAAPGTSENDLPEQGEVQVACTVDARLVMSPQDASLSSTDWESRQYVPARPAEWVWLVVPLKSGDLTASLEVRPIITVANGGDPQTTEYATERYRIDIAVDQGFWDRVSSLTTQAQALLALVTALTALAVALGIRKWGPPVWRRVRGAGPS